MTIENTATAPIGAIETAGEAPPISFARLACALCLMPAVALGFGRFAYSLILPAMRTELGWTYSQAGGLNTANAVGYLLGALLAAPVIHRFSTRNTMLCGMTVVVASLTLSGMASAYAVVLLARALVGVAGAVLFITGAGLAARLGETEGENALAISLYFSGPGLGIILSGLLLPPILAGAAAAHWRVAWFLLAGIGVLVLILLLAVSRHLEAPAPPELELGHTPIPLNWKPLLPGMLAYFGYGLGYIAYMTFLIAYLRTRGAPTGTVVAVWTAIGLSMIICGPLWRNPLVRWKGGNPMALMLFLVAAGALLPLFSDSLPVVVLSAITFGAGTMPVIAAITVQIRKHLPMTAWNLGIAVATIVFAVGQSLGPLGSGALSDHFGLKAALIWTVVIILISTSVALHQRDPDFGH